MANLTDTQKVIANAMSEEELLNNIIALAKAFGWLIAHFRPGQTKDGQWRTPVQGDRGFPDLVLARSIPEVGYKQLFIIELKSEKGRLSPEQKAWKDALVYLVWRPSDWLDGTVERSLK